MSVLRILFTRLRLEEKLLNEAAKREGIPCELQNVTDVYYGGRDFCSPDDVVLARCVSHNENESVAALLESQGVRVVNSSRVMALCGNKLSTTLALKGAEIPQPDFRVAFTPEAALEASLEMGLPVVYKPVLGSWGRLLAKVNDIEAAEAVLEHKSMLGAIHNIFYIQQYIEKGGSDVRAFVVNGTPICAISRNSAHWITNTARGATASNIPVDETMGSILRRVQGAIGGEFLAVDLFGVGDGWLVNEVNDGGEFRNSIEPTGTDIPGAVVRAAWEARPR
ncbi:MAG: RimK family alpha-L-glutamate ligase [Synergistaceae bacterium]|nr:RimK family alpha-L-glutamate ligase [Synergistaceae bacterium]